MPLLEVGAFPPPRSRNDIILPVVVQVTEACALRPELVAQLDPFERVNGVVISRCNEGPEESKAREYQKFAHSVTASLINHALLSNAIQAGPRGRGCCGPGRPAVRRPALGA